MQLSVSCCYSLPFRSLHSSEEQPKRNVIQVLSILRWGCSPQSPLRGTRPTTYSLVVRCVLNMRALPLTVATALASLSVAKRCMNATVPVSISSRQAIFGNVNVPHTSEEVTAIAQAAAVHGVNSTAQALTDYHTVTGTYNISTQFCTPDNLTSTIPIVQVLTHGIGFDKTCNCKFLVM